MNDHVINFIFCFAPSLWIKLPKNEVHHYRMCAVYLYADEGDKSMFWAYTLPPSAHCRSERYPLPRMCSEVHSSSYAQCEQCWDLHLFCLTKVVITLTTHFAGEVSRTPIPFLGTKLTNCNCLGVSMIFLLPPWLKTKVKVSCYKNLAIQVPWVLCIATVALVSPF